MMPQLSELLLLLAAFCPLSSLEWSNIFHWPSGGRHAWLSNKLENEVLKLLCGHKVDEEPALRVSQTDSYFNLGSIQVWEASSEWASGTCSEIRRAMKLRSSSGGGWL